MASNYTSNYQLCQWKETDKVLRTEFNADNAKIDAAIAAVDSRVSSVSGGKASISALNSVKSTVDSLVQTVAEHTSELAKKGNCQLYATSYTGDGGYGSSSWNSLTFPHKPFAVVVAQGTGALLLFQGVQGGAKAGGSDGVIAQWSGNTVKWYHHLSAQAQMNERTYTYLVFALLEL